MALFGSIPIRSMMNPMGQFGSDRATAIGSLVGADLGAPKETQQLRNSPRSAIGDSFLVSGGVMTPPSPQEIYVATLAQQARQANQGLSSGYDGYRVNPYMMDLSDIGYNTAESYTPTQSTQPSGQNYSDQFIQSMGGVSNLLKGVVGQGTTTPEMGEPMGVVDPTANVGGGMAFKSPIASGIMGGGVSSGIMNTGLGKTVGKVPILGDVVSGMFDPGGSSADAYAQMMGQAMAQQEGMTERGASFQQPYVQGGGIGMEQLMRGALSGEYDPGQFEYEGSPISGQGMNDWQWDPSYQFRLDESQKAIDRAAAAGGRFGGGATAKALQKNAQDLASQEYENIYNRRKASEEERYRRAGAEYLTEAQRLQQNQNLFRDIAGIGQGSANTLTNVYGGLGNQLMSSTQSVAEAKAAAEAAAMNAQNQMVGGLLNAGINYLTGGF